MSLRNACLVVLHLWLQVILLWLSSPQDILAAAVSHHEAGRLGEAESLYGAILAHDANQPDALHLLGVLFGQTHREEEAIGLIKRAIALRPGAISYHNNLGNVLRQSGQLKQAIASFKMALELDPTHARAWNNLGNALRDDDQTDAAIAAYQRSLALAPEIAEVHSNLGIAFGGAGKLDEAIASHRRAIELSPRSSEAFNNLGVALRDKGLVKDAVIAHQRGVHLAPDSLSALSNLGAALRRIHRPQEAIEVLRRALAIDPAYPDAHNNLGSALIDLGDFQSAADCCRRAIQLRPGYADAHGNLAIALAYMGQVDDAMREARLAVNFMPRDPLAHWNLSMLLLLVGDFELGWREHEWRWKCPSMLKVRHFAQPRWNGESLDGQTVLLFAEQGFGDMLQFIRFAPLIAQLGGRAIVECQSELFRLFQFVPGIARLIAVGQPLPEFDLRCPLMSVPFAMLDRNFAPAAIPYLAPPNQRSASSKWQINRSTINIGLAWAGDRAHQNDRARSIPLHLLSPLSQIPGITFHSLQKKPPFADATEPTIAFPIIDHSHELTDFADTADLIEQLDLIISVDTAVAHLAGSMGKATYVMLPFMPDWRWLLHRTDSDWYPTMRLFRQPKMNAWEPVIQAVVKALEERTSQ